MNKISPHFGRQKGYSLVFAFLIMTVIMIVASATITNTTGKIRYFNELEGGSQARLAAESAAELAITDIKDYQSGYNVSLNSDAFCLDSNSDGVCESSGDYEVIATGQENEDDGMSGEYYIPIPGSGSAAPSSECVFDLDEPAGVDNPCNWNKLLYGDSVTIPLFNDNGDGTTDDLVDLGFTNWELRLRTPCEDVSDGDYDEECDRYEFYGVITDDDWTGTVFDEDPIILSWQIYGTDTSGATINEIPDDLSITRGGIKQRDYDTNTEISEHSINEAYDNEDYVLLTGDNTYADTFEFNTVESTPSHSQEIDAVYDELYLQLEIVHAMDSYPDGDTIPYLEWQLVLTGSEGLADNGSILTGYGYSESFSRTYFHYFYEKYLTTGERGGVYTLSN